MSKEMIKNITEGDKEGFLQNSLDLISEKIEAVLAEKYVEIGNDMFTTTEEVSENNAFASVVTQAIEENANINLEISVDERLEITPEIAKVISETHDELPKELQRSFRETIFESKEKFLSILESITLGDEE
jgi:hypothetical protein|tara:strand:+ start:528 stop:920 length:393 start_codon:yes stop_codon:yes gene_type:complete